MADAPKLYLTQDERSSSLLISSIFHHPTRPRSNGSDQSFFVISISNEAPWLPHDGSSLLIPLPSTHFSSQRNPSPPTSKGVLRRDPSLFSSFCFLDSQISDVGAYTSEDLLPMASSFGKRFDRRSFGGGSSKRKRRPETGKFIPTTTSPFPFLSFFYIAPSRCPTPTTRTPRRVNRL